MGVRFFIWLGLTCGWTMIYGQQPDPSDFSFVPPTLSSSLPAPLDCNCMITQSGVSYSVSALQGTQTAPAFYSYGTPIATSANTGLELNNGLVIFLYEDVNTGVISLFLIADQPNSGSGGTMEFEISCLPPEAFVSVQDDVGEFFGTPPVITGDWFWLGCCTDGGVIEDIGCGNTLVLDLLISSGLDSIVWLTGDIANPDLILLSMSGEAITITCGGGGGVCCPLGFDTETTVVNATCPDSPNGSIALDPQDGVPNYTYDWSNGESTQNITGLLPGLYLVTVTDAQGCTEELQFTIGVSPGDPPAIPANMEVCSATPEGLFDLTMLDDIINLNSGWEVLWFENANLTGMINTPDSYLSPTATIYAVVDNGSCLSDPVPVQLTVNLAPVAMPASVSLCEEQNDMATFDLTALENLISGGAGEVDWYTDALLTSLILSPGSFLTGSTTVYAVVDDGTCASEPAEVELQVNLKPEAFEASMHLCGNEFDEAVFDLTLLENDISGGNGSVDWYQESDLSDPISNPFQFLTTTTTVYAVVYDGTCYSDPVEVDLFVDALPTANPLMLTACDEGTGQAWFDLPEHDTEISGGAGGVGWYYDVELEEAILNPGFFLTGSTIVFAAVDDGECVSDPVQVELIVIPVPEGNPVSTQTCPDSTGMGLFDLTALETSISGGIGSVMWYEDALGNFDITTPSAYLSSGGVVYAQIEEGPCLSALIPVTLQIVSSVQATPTTYAACDEGGGVATFNLITIQQQVSNGTGQVLWYLDPAGTMPVITPDSFPGSNDTVYARVTAGGCVSDIVEIALEVIPLPPVYGWIDTLCGDTTGMVIVDLTLYDSLISLQQGTVTWYGDATLTQSISGPMTFFTGDTVLFVTVSAGGCTTKAEEVVLNVAVMPVAHAVAKTFCILTGEEQTLDLSLYETEIHSAGLPVHWYTDPAGLLTLANLADFHLTTDTTVYVRVSDGLCFSEAATVQFDVETQPIAQGTTLRECGDANNQALFNLLSIESWVSQNSGVVTWYTDPMLTNLLSTPAAFLSGDTTIYAIVQNGFCSSPAVPVIIEVTDSLVASPHTIEICVQETMTTTIDLTAHDIWISGGAGIVNWFADNQGINPILNPASFTTSGDTVFARVVSGSCLSNLATVPVYVLGAYPPDPVCAFSSLDSVSITWQNVTDEYDLSYLIPGEPWTGPLGFQATTFGLGGLIPGDSITFELTAVFDSICTNDLIQTITCATSPCPPATLSIQDAGTFCADDLPVSLTATWSGIPGIPEVSWSGPGITDPSGTFDPSSAMVGENEVTVSITGGSCHYTASDTLTVHPIPVSTFDLSGTLCPDSVLHVAFTGQASGQAEFFWTFNGAIVQATAFPEEYDLRWTASGSYLVSLMIEDRGCFSETESTSVNIDMMAAPPVLLCRDEDYHSVTVQWQPVPGANGYEISTTAGNYQVTGNTLTVFQLTDDSDVSVTIEALGVSDCGPSIATITCHTRAYEPINTYIPNAFSPNQDGINDVFFIQSNPGITGITLMRIYDRWGNLVFEKNNFLPNDPQYGWDGSFHGQILNPGVYTYWAQLETIRGPGMTVAGDVTLVR